MFSPNRLHHPHLQYPLYLQRHPLQALLAPPLAPLQSVKSNIFNITSTNYINLTFKLTQQENLSWKIPTVSFNETSLHRQKLTQTIWHAADLPVHPGGRSCWGGACALSCRRKTLCQPADSLSAAWPSQTEPQPNPMQSGPQHLPEKRGENSLFNPNFWAAMVKKQNVQHW